MKDLEEYKNKYYEYLTEEKAMSYLNTKDLDSYYVDFYKNEIVGDIQTEKNDTTVKESIESIISLFEYVVKDLRDLDEAYDQSCLLLEE